MVAFDWSVEIPEELWRALVYSVATVSWREALRESRPLGARLRGFRPESVPVRELDRILLRALHEDPEVRDLAIERFAAENARLVTALGTLGPEGAKGETLDGLLRDETIGRVFWAAFRGGEPWSGVRDALLSRVRTAALGGAELYPPRLERRPRGAPPPPAPGPTPPPPDGRGTEDALRALGDRLHRAERELLRAREDRDRLREDLARREAVEARLLADRERLERELRSLRERLREREQGPPREAPETKRAAQERELERLGEELLLERRQRAEATQRARELRRELELARGRLEYLESLAVSPSYAKEPASVSSRAACEKIVWPREEHHYPKRLRPFLERLARSPYIDRIQVREFEDSTETRLKAIDDRGNIYVQYSDGVKAVRVYVTTVATCSNEGRWIADRLREIEPSLA